MKNRISDFSMKYFGGAAMAIIIISVVLPLFAAIRPDKVLSDISAIHPWVLALVLLAVFSVNSILLSKERKTVLVAAINIVILAAAFELIYYLWHEKSLLMVIFSELSLVAADISYLVWEAREFREKILVMEAQILLILTIVFSFCFSNRGAAVPWIIEIIIALVLCFVGYSMGRQDVRNVLPWGLGTGALLGGAVLLRKPVSTCLDAIFALIGKGLKAIVALAERFVLWITGFEYNLRNDPTISTESQSSSAQQATEISNNFELIRVIVIVLLITGVATCLYALLSTFIKWLLKNKISAKTAKPGTGERLSWKSLIDLIKRTVNRALNYLYLCKHKDSAAYVLVSLEKKYRSNSELSRKANETPKEFIEKILASGKLSEKEIQIYGDLAEKIDEAFYSSDYNILKNIHQGV